MLTVFLDTCPVRNYYLYLKGVPRAYKANTRIFIKSHKEFSHGYASYRRKL